MTRRGQRLGQLASHALILIDLPNPLEFRDELAQVGPAQVPDDLVQLIVGERRCNLLGEGLRWSGPLRSVSSLLGVSSRLEILQEASLCFKENSASFGFPLLSRLKDSGLLGVSGTKAAFKAWTTRLGGRT
ncbi:hypothetical protein BK022_13545 [Methylorubrum extorquens]|uniref:Uncharacterized protein n=1 Tax=Methylorubrum extorquens TaxID=408 RepID=A0A1S1P8K1_METEX|nr:hypothetical protein BK022_13545 [Methylorubrum extorquens]